MLPLAPNSVLFQANNNQLETLGEGLGELVMLTSLDLANNKLKMVPEGIGFLSHVTSLNLSQNMVRARRIETLVSVAKS